MGKHYLHSDITFSKQFEAGTLNPSLFTHEAHLRLAWIYIKNFGIDVACKLLCTQIIRFDTIHGDGTKFHKTLTVAAVKAVWHFIQRSKSTTFHDFIQEFPRLKYNFNDLISTHYSPDVLQHEQAKIVYMPPNLLPFT